MQRQAIRGCQLLDIISARQIVVRSAPPPSSPAPSAHRCAAVGLDRSARPNKEAFVPLLGICADAGPAVRGQKGERAVAAHAHLTECRNERRHSCLYWVSAPMQGRP
jgi:hypothetical protein